MFTVCWSSLRTITAHAAPELGWRGGITLDSLSALVTMWSRNEDRVPYLNAARWPLNFLLLCSPR